MQHLIVAPILLPLLAAAVMVLLGESRRRAKAALGVSACTLGLLIALALLLRVDTADAAQAFGVYLPANWEVPFGIVLVVDRLSALMLVLGALVGLASVLYSLARWHRAGIHFHPLLQMQLMGLNGAFLTADLFNLFVFFEVMLAASYGLLLHGPNVARVRAGLHYVAINLVASLLFLIGVAVIYGVTGTLNMADIAQKLPRVPDADRGLMHAGAAVLAVAFLVKAALWPLNFWLPPAYHAASAPVAALFALLTKVGVYAVLRTWTLFFPAAGAPPFATDALVWGGLATLAFGALGMLASMQLSRLAGYSIIVSSGTVLAAIGFGNAPLTAGALYYLVGSTLAASALFLLVELIERMRAIDVDAPLPDAGAGLPTFAPEPPAPIALAELDADEAAPIGRAIPAAVAFLGIGFVICALLIAGLPPLSGFIGKFAMLSALLAAPAGAPPPPTAERWALFALLIGSGFLSAIALSRAGIRHFWAPQDRPPPRLRVIECLPLALLLLACVWLVLRADVALRYAHGAAEVLHRPSLYIDAVMSARPAPPPGTRP